MRDTEAEARPKDILRVFGANDLYSQEELKKMTDDFANRGEEGGGSGGNMFNAESIRADVMGASGRNDVDDEDDGPKEELTAGEIRYWQYQVRRQ